MLRIVVVVGGDGSLLGLSEWPRRRPWWAQSRRTGLAAISPEQIDTKFQEILDGQFTTEEHFLLQASIMRDGEDSSAERIERRRRQSWRSWA